ncbi:molybdenum cofactor guanylyltransferase [Aggregicoccus sp. 17bor-14]|uniref:molybdenum cofactor guanylyltransferase n=1 Tax=Myxococcaceae TaxID=31 RepID=UPI00129CEB02|nr:MULTISPECIES: molybdenum cofactor guanylyltransferase [Myxococcaceae]MBF5044272.1 molybdenum cofactor guanylyltransferase [Simulacricoccus sp. 17bor-14]MRI90022.1 molybdenum cofactor guanylyltransferase [Aggregicoccus sp. 17bor-14]
MTSASESSAAASDTTLALIAGGRGSRLGGVAKGLLRWRGRTLLEHQLQLAPGFARVLLVTGDPAPYARWGLETVADVIPGRGAPGGVHAALAHARTPWVLALGCDMPFVTRAALAPLLAARAEGGMAVLYRVGGRLEPLLALYRAALAPRWGPLLSGERGPSFTQLLAAEPVTVLEEAALRAVDPELASVRSVNTPEDLDSLGVQRP